VNRLRITNYAILQNNQGPWNHGISKTISPQKYKFKNKKKNRERIENEIYQPVKLK